MNIAITGSTGFLGNHLIEFLKKKDICVKVFDKKKHNLLNPEKMQDFVIGSDIIIHLAVENKSKDTYKMFRTNVLGTRGLLTAIERYNPNVRIIFASSFRVYVKNDLFGLSKRIAEEFIEQAFIKKKNNVIILRFSNIYGKGGLPFKQSVINTIIYQIKEGMQIVINGDGEQKRDFLYIDDAVYAILEAIRYTKKELRYFDICTGVETSLNDIIAILKENSKKDLSVYYNFAHDRDQSYNTKRNFLCAWKKLKWKPKISISAGLKRCIKDKHVMV